MPVLSIVKIVLVTAKNVIFCASDRNCTPAPPTSKAPIAFASGGFNIDLTVTKFRFNKVPMYNPAATNSLIDVANAAPATPKALIVPKPKINIGSKITFINCDANVIFIGVVTSNVPRNAANPTVLTIAGINVNARIPIYGAACIPVAETGSRPTKPNAGFLKHPITVIPNKPTINAQNIPSPILFCNSALSPPAAALATIGATTEGMNDMIQNAD